MSYTYKGRDKRGRDVYQIRVGVTTNGVRRHYYETVVGLSETKVRHREQELWVKARGGDLVVSTATTLQDYFDHFLATRRDKAPRTMKSYKTKMAAVLERFGKTKLTGITRPAVMRWNAEQQGTALTRRGRLVTFRQVMDEARKDGLVVRNVVADIELPVERESSKRALSDDELEQLLSAIRKTGDVQLYCAATLIAYCGLRPSEMLALRVDEVDEDRILHAHSSMNDDGTIEGDTRTKRHSRDIPVHHVAWDAISRQRQYLAQLKLEWRPIWQESGLLFVQKNTTKGKPGRPWLPVVFQHAWQRSMAHINAAALEDWTKAGNDPAKFKAMDWTPNELRHTCLTRWRRMGLRMEAVQYLAGHAEGSDVTAKVYTRHVSAEEVEAVRG